MLFEYSQLHCTERGYEIISLEMYLYINNCPHITMCSVYSYLWSFKEASNEKQYVKKQQNMNNGINYLDHLLCRE